MTMAQDEKNRTATLLSLVALLILNVSCLDNCDRHHVNGCSVGVLRNLKIIKTYTPACNRHDVCYACGVGRGIARRECDSALRDDILTICEQNIDPNDNICSAIASTAYGSVRLFGWLFYNQTGRPWCHEDFVQDCLPR